MLVTMGIFINYSKEQLKIAVMLSGGTVAFMVFFSLLIVFLACTGALITRSRGIRNLVVCMFSIGLFFFGFVPLMVVSSALVAFNDGSQVDLALACNADVTDTTELSKITGPYGVVDIEESANHHYSSFS